jgi:SPX domain protein involved in polyphosphate accumulation
MSAALSQGAPSFDADERMTADRVEQKYLVPAEHVGRLLGDLTRQLPTHRFVGEGANRLPGAHHFVTTIYFDTDTRAHYRASIENGSHNIKIRAKEYYDLHPSLAELATHAGQIVRYQPWVWFELKRRDGLRTHKTRFRLPKRQVPEFFSRGRLVMDALARSDGDAGAESPEALSAVMAYCQSLSEPLRASTVVNYRRLSFQDLKGELRVTLDLSLAFYSPPGDLWTREQALLRSTLGNPEGVLKTAVLEVKRRAENPPWLAALLTRAGVTEVSFSKFVAATQAVYRESVGR